MPEYDAFGREIGEDTLSGLGGDPSPTSSVAGSEVPIAPPPQPQPQSQPQAPQPGTFTIPTQIPGSGRPKKSRRGSSGLGCLIGLVVLAAVVAGPTTLLWDVYDEGPARVWPAVGGSHGSIEARATTFDVTFVPASTS